MYIVVICISPHFDVVVESELVCFYSFITHSTHAHYTSPTACKLFYYYFLRIGTLRCVNVVCRDHMFCTHSIHGINFKHNMSGLDRIILFFFLLCSSTAVSIVIQFVFKILLFKIFFMDKRVNVTIKSMNSFIDYALRVTMPHPELQMLIFASDEIIYTFFC